MKEKYKGFWTLFIWFGSIGLLFLLIGCFLYFTIPYKTEKVLYTIPIVALQDSPNGSSRSVLGTSCFSDGIYYIVMIKKGSNVFKIRKLNADIWKVIEERDIKPRLEYKKKFTYTRLSSKGEEELTHYPFYHNGIEDLKRELDLYDPKIFIPKGTIVQNYNVDLN